MIGMARDTWRAVLVIVVVVLLRAVLADWPAPQQRQPPPGWPPAAPQPMPAPQPTMQPIIIQPQAQQQPERPLRRVAAALTELGDSVIGVVR